ncbi:hypothetical protein OIV83_006163 [Microbotryomycetes sp. JL201]|nr:hypothetical protein OIV83_006163 [Microbotryomycetes sp. JL201]
MHCKRKLLLLTHGIPSLPGGDLFSYLAHKKALGTAETKWITYQLLMALNYLHNVKGVAHCDVKLENVVLATASPFPAIALADFGQASYIKKECTSMRGTVTYMAPEVLEGNRRMKGYDLTKADCWSTGVVVATLLLGQQVLSPSTMLVDIDIDGIHSHPFEPVDTHYEISSSAQVLSIFGETKCALGSERDVALCFAILNEAFVPGPLLAMGTWTQAQTFLQSLLDKDPAVRSSAEQALEKSWIEVSETFLAAMYHALCAFA